MKVVHFCQMAPNKSGMYESTKDQIKYERREGIESDIVDSMSALNTGRRDDWLDTVSWEKAKDAEIWVIHSHIPPPLEKYIADEKKRKKHVILSNCHGPVEHMLLKEYGAAMLNNHDMRTFTETHINMVWSHDACVGVVMASAGYPGKYKTGFPVKGLDKVDKDLLIFHAGTKLGDDRTVYTNGGRVLTAVGTGENMAEAREKVYRNLANIYFEGCHYRKDIALREII